MKYLFGDCQVDVARRELIRNGETIELEPQMFQLLALLLGHRDRAISKDEIFETVWEGRAITDSVLTTRIRSLRRAIDTDNTSSHIKTLHRVGYRFESDVKVIEEEQTITEPPKVSGSFVESEVDAKHAFETNDPTSSDPQNPAVGGRPSIAILPLENFSDDPEQGYFSDGLSEDLIAAISKFREISVIGRNSSFALRDANLTIAEISKKLGARYVLEGSVRRSQDRVRITIQLLDGVDDSHIWAEKYDRRIEDIFAVQDEVTQAIVLSLLPHISQSERKRAQRKPPQSLDAWESYQYGIALSHAFTDIPVEEELRYFARAVELDPSFAEAHAELSYWNSVVALTSEPGADWDAACRTALEAAKLAIDLDELSPKAWVAQARIKMLIGQNEDALVAAKRAVEINPDSAFGNYILGKALWQSGEPISAIDKFDRALTIDSTDWWKSAALGSKAGALAMLGKYEEALSVVRQADMSHVQRNIMTSMGELCALGHLELVEEARVALIAANKATRSYGNQNDFTLAYIDKAFPMTESAAKDHFYEGLRKANLPEAG